MATIVYEIIDAVRTMDGLIAELLRETDEERQDRLIIAIKEISNQIARLDEKLESILEWQKTINQQNE